MREYQENVTESSQRIRYRSTNKSTTSSKLPGQRAALVVAHPGHELCVYHWLQLARPQVFIFTDGSGHSGTSRLHTTTRILKQVGAEPGCIYGRLTDRAIYAATMNHDFDLFINLAEELAEAFLRERIEYVVGDAIEGYNPAHDICRFVINASIEMANRTSGDPIVNLDVLTTQPGDHLQMPVTGAISLHLDKSALEEKLRAVLGYSELAADVDRILEQVGVDGLETECLRSVDVRESSMEEQPYYELYGERQVATGHYRQVLRYREHVLPLAEALQQHIERTNGRIANTDYQ